MFNDNPNLKPPPTQGKLFVVFKMVNGKQERVGVTRAADKLLADKRATMVFGSGSWAVEQERETVN